MKKTVITLATLGIMAGGPKAHAQLDSTKVKTNENLISAVTNERTPNEDSTKTISFKDVKESQENEELFKVIMKNRKVKKLAKRYGKERIEKILGEMIADKNFLKDMSGLLENQEARETLEVVCDEAVQKLAEQYGGEEIGEMLDLMIRNGYGVSEIKKLFNNPEVQKALKDGNKKELLALQKEKDKRTLVILGISGSLVTIVLFLMFYSVWSNRDDLTS